jgi:hypothetical protein
MAKKTGTMAKVGNSLKDAVQTVAQAADDYVVQPVGKAVGLIEAAPDKRATPTKRTTKAVRKAGRKVSAAAETAARKAAPLLKGSKK